MRPDAEEDVRTVLTGLLASLEPRSLLFRTYFQCAAVMGFKTRHFISQGQVIRTKNYESHHKLATDARSSQASLYQPVSQQVSQSASQSVCLHFRPDFLPDCTLFSDNFWLIVDAVVVVVVVVGKLN